MVHLLLVEAHLNVGVVSEWEESGRSMVTKPLAAPLKLQRNQMVGSATLCFAIYHLTICEVAVLVIGLNHE